MDEATKSVTSAPRWATLVAATASLGLFACKPVEPGTATYVKSYSLVGADFEPRSAVSTTNGGSYHLGVVTSVEGRVGKQALAIVRLDDQGDVMAGWPRRYGGDEVPAGLSRIVGAVEATDGNVWIAGSSSEGATVLQLNANGEQVARLILDSPQQPVDLRAIAATSRGGFIVAGMIQATNSEARRLTGGDVWLARGGSGGPFQVFDDLPPEINAETVNRLEVDPRNDEVVVCGEQYTEGDAAPRFWVATFNSGGGGRLGFSLRSGVGSCQAVVTVPRILPGSNADRPGLVAVGSGGLGDEVIPRIVYRSLREGDLEQDEGMELRYPTRFNHLGYNNVVLHDDVNSVVATANVQYQGLVQVLTRRVDPRDGRLKFLGAAPRRTEELGSELEGVGRIRRLLRTRTGDYVLLVRVLGRGWAAIPLRHGDLKPLGPRFQLDLSDTDEYDPTDLALTADGGLLAWGDGRLLRLDGAGRERWRKEYARATTLSAEPVGVAELTDGGALVAAALPGGSMLLSYGPRGELRHARRYDGLSLQALQPLDRDGDGKLGDQVLAVARGPGGTQSLLLHLDPTGAATYAARLPGNSGLVGPVSSGGGRIVAHTQAGPWWFDRGSGRSLDLWARDTLGQRYGEIFEALVTPDEGLWSVAAGGQGTVNLVRHDRRGRLQLAKRALGRQGASLFEYSGRVAVRADGGLLVAGEVVVPRAGDICADRDNCADAAVISFDWRGEASWMQGYGAARKEGFHFGNRRRFGDLVAAPGSGLLLGALSTSYSFPRSSLFVVRADADGLVNSDCQARSAGPFEVTVTAVEAPPVAQVAIRTAPAPVELPLPAFTELPSADTPLALVTARSCSGAAGAPELQIEIGGEGRVVSTPASGIDCPGDCAQVFPRGSVIPLTAMPKEGFRLAGWEGACSGAEGRLEVTLDRSKSCTARFTPGRAPPGDPPPDLAMALPPAPDLSVPVGDAAGSPMGDLAGSGADLASADLAGPDLRRPDLEPGDLASSCADARLNGSETDVDCGGSCPPCADNRGCRVAADCENGLCLGARCIGGVIGAWSFSENMGTRAADSSGFDNAATLVKTTAALPAWTGGKVGSALAFDGSNYVTAPDSPSLGPTSRITIAAWVTADALFSNQTLLAKSSAGEGYGLYVDGVVPNARLCGFVQQTNKRVCATFANTMTFRHVALTYDGKSLRLYFDGVEAAAAPSLSVVRTTMAPLVIGGSGAGGGWSGKIDQVRIYSRALSAAEISALHNNP